MIYAKPILDKYGFKASFFIICGRVGTERSSMNWQDIAELKKDGMDIESHSMTHTNLNRLSTNALEFEIGGSKQCFAKHGYYTPISLILRISSPIWSIVAVKGYLFLSLLDDWFGYVSTIVRKL
ncbi:MAG: polysaccharide deacetylase family protein, partial [Candidatus Nitrosopolaris sp.]